MTKESLIKCTIGLIASLLTRLLVRSSLAYPVDMPRVLAVVRLALKPDITFTQKFFKSIPFVLVFFMASESALADETQSENAGQQRGTPMEIQKVYIDVHTGPGRGYPVFHALERDEDIRVLKSRTDWYKIQTLGRYQPVSGWVHRSQLDGSRLEDGSLADLRLDGWGDLGSNRWTWSGSAGDFDGAESLDMSIGYRLTPNLHIEATYGQATGDFSDIQYAYLKVNSAFRPIWRITPYFTVGAGSLTTEPNTKLVQSEQRDETSMLAGLGLRAYLTRSFFMRLEYNQHLVLTDRDTNEDVNQWTFGLSVAF